MRAARKGTVWLTLSLLMLLLAAHPVGASHPPTRPVSIGVNDNWEPNLTRSANMGWVRMDISWAEIVSSPGAWNIQQTNSRVNNAVNNGQQVLGVLHYVPSWLGTGDADTPPLSTADWSAFVRRLAQEFRGRIAAYEIWNEPDQKNVSGGDGIGWGRNIEEPPLYIDFVRAAALEIRAQAPGTLIVAPAFQSRNDGDGADNRKRRILQQAEGTIYPGGFIGSDFIDVVSVHNNAFDTEGSLTMGIRLNYQNLAYVWNHAASMRHRPIWVTEYGWKTSLVSESEQRKRICEVTKMYSGYLSPGSTDLDDWDVRRSFIYALKDGGSRQIFRNDNTPKPVVTQYLQFMSYPAVQQPNNSPSCAGTGFSATMASGPEDAGTAFADLGFRDPRPAIPSGFTELSTDRSSDGLATEVLFGDSAGGKISIVVSQASPGNDGRGVLSEAGAQWTSSVLHVSVAGMRGTLPIGKSILRSIGAALDPSFGRACMIESVSADESAVRRFGFSVPKAPSGFTKTATQIEYTRPTKGCGAAASAHVPVLDFTWTFEDAAGDVVRAGIYRYEQSFDAAHSGERSLHWSGKGGARYWVAADPAVLSPDGETLRAIAESMDSAFGQ